jgi:hypothetical protein
MLVPAARTPANQRRKAFKPIMVTRTGSRMPAELASDRNSQLEAEL